MKKQLLAFFALILLQIPFFYINAQKTNFSDPNSFLLPLDPKVRCGKLDNGLTYYIRNNKIPEQHAEFYLTQKNGFVSEESSQLGMLHFIEQYFKITLAKYKEHLTTFTDYDDALYCISDVSVVKEGVIDSCLLILREWVAPTSFSSGSIEKTRNLVYEEIKTGKNNPFTQVEKLLPQIMPETPYAKCMPYGKIETVKNFNSQNLLNFYKKWNAPENQSIIIVGDINVALVEKKIKNIFSNIPKQTNSVEKKYFSIPDNNEPLIGIVKDKEIPQTQISVYFKHDSQSGGQYASMQTLITDYIKMIVSNIFYARFSELGQKSDIPFTSAKGYDGDFLVAKNTDAWTLTATVKENEINKSLKIILEETLRAKKEGFTEAEFEKARKNILLMYEMAFKERANEENKTYAITCANHFTLEGYMTGIEYEYDAIKNIDSRINLALVNRFFAQLIGDKNIAISLLIPDGKDVVTPSKTELSNWFNEYYFENLQLKETIIKKEVVEQQPVKKVEQEPIKKNETTPPVKILEKEPVKKEIIKEEIIEEISNLTGDEPLMTTLPKAGTIKSETKDSRFGTTNFVLSNGVKVIIKQTKFKDNEILMGAISAGGTSLFPETNPANIKLYPEISTLGGLSKFSKADLNKILGGKSVFVSPTINVTTEGLTGRSVMKEFETMLELIYLNFTSPREDKKTFLSYLIKNRSDLEKLETQPTTTMVDTIIKSLYADLTRNAQIKANEIPQLNYDTIMSWRKDRYSDAGNFTFVFVGNIDANIVKPFITQYLASLPSTNRKESFFPVNMMYNKGVIKNYFEKPMENPQTYVTNIYSGTFEPTLLNRIKMDFLRQILKKQLTEKLKDKSGENQELNVISNIADYPVGQATLHIAFEIDSFQKDLFSGFIKQEMNSFMETGPKTEDFNSIKDLMRKKYAKDILDNNYWKNTIMNYYHLGYDANTDYLKLLDNITPSDMKNFAKDLEQQGNLVDVMMIGVKSTY